MVRTISKLFVALFFLPLSASAQVVITEIMYDLMEGSDTGREWIEVQNTGSESVNLVEWKLYENDTNHGLKAMGGETLTPGAYAIISDNPAKFATDWPSYSGLVFDSAFALNNTGETVVLRCCGKEPTDRDSVTYNNTGGGNGDGLSLHRSGSTIIAARPSPGSGTVEVPTPQPKEPAPEPEPTPPPKQQVQPIIQEKQKEPEVEIHKIETKQESQTPSASLVPATIVVQEEKEIPPLSKKTRVKMVDEMEEVFEEGEMAQEVAQAQPIPSAQFAAAETSVPSPSSDMIWWLGAAAVSFFGAGGAYLAGRRKSERDWKIEEVQ